MTPGANALKRAHNAMQTGNTAACLSHAKAAVGELPYSAEAWWLLGSAASGEDDTALAEKAFLQAARFSPKGSKARAQMLILRGKPLISEGRMAEAVESTREGVAIGVDDLSSLIRASYTFTHAGLPEEALTCVRRATRLSPRDAEAWYSLGSTYRTLGDITLAESAFNRAIEFSSTPPVAAYYNLANLRRWTASDNHIDLLETLTCRSSLEACRVAYTLFKEYDDIGEIDKAWDCLSVGASLARKIEDWSSKEEAEMVAAWQTHFPSSRFASRDIRPRPGPRRIFIVGLPRSGTTLVERILTAHSQVQALGELKTIGVVTHKQSSVSSTHRLDPSVIAASARLDPLEIAEAYHRETAYLLDGSPVVIDKLPSNHEYVGLIQLAFPDAVIIALERNPMDSLFGALKVLFTGAYGWSYDQGDLVEHYRHFRTLMNYWEQVLGDRLIRVSLEHLIDNQESEIRRIVDACGLPFEEGCLRPHEAKGGVSTASAVQVRNPINSQGVGAWKRYQTYLAPLADGLSKHGFTV